MSATDVIALLLAGMGGGAINVAAGGGSFLTLPVLMALGLPPATANATNRVAIFTQNVAAAWSFKRKGVLLWPWVWRATLASTLAAPLGVLLATQIPPDDFKKILAILMIAVTILSILYRKDADEGGDPKPPTLKLMGAFALIGLYAGFIQAGTGFFILGALSWCGLDLVRGNGVKVCSIVGATAISIVTFIFAGDINWPAGLVLAIGTAIGSQFGVTLTTRVGHRRLRWIVLGLTFLAAILLWTQL